MKTQSIEIYRKWVAEVLSMPNVADTLVNIDVKKALDNSMSLSMTRSHADLELLISH